MSNTIKAIQGPREVVINISLVSRTVESHLSPCRIRLRTLVLISCHSSTKYKIPHRYISEYLFLLYKFVTTKTSCVFCEFFWIAAKNLFVLDCSFSLYKLSVFWKGSMAIYFVVTAFIVVTNYLILHSRFNTHHCCAFVASPFVTVIYLMFMFWYSSLSSDKATFEGQRSFLFVTQTKLSDDVVRRALTRPSGLNTSQTRHSFSTSFSRINFPRSR